jgi:hypothetical protein
MSTTLETLFETDATEPAVQEGLSPADLITVRAVEGWLKLGSPHEALKELDGIQECARSHIVVLMARAHVYAAMGWGETSLALARVVCEVEPHFPAAWLCHANILRDIRGLGAAKDLLVSVADRFSGEPLVGYYIACISAQLGEMADAAKWLLRAFESDSTVELKLKAIQEPDLDPLWKRILESIDAFETGGLSKLAALSQYPA